MNHIKRIYIDSYRGIKTLELKDLTQINILTGDNNCGKTSVLEVIRSLDAPDRPRSWFSLTRREALLTRMSYYEGVYDLFDVNSEEKKLKYTIIMDKEIHMEISATPYEKVLSGEQYERLLGLRPVKENEENQDDSDYLVPFLNIDVSLNGKNISKWKVADGQRGMPGGIALDRRSDYAKNVVYISPTSHADGRLYLNEVLDNPELYEEMLEVLKEYDPDIISINADNKNNSFFSGGIYKILSKSHQKALPLNVYGDGMKKAILLMSAVIKAKDGILLLDEFETAIHTSAMNKTFRWILENCKKLNVQVFMTSHSKEAIDKVLKCSPTLKNDITLYTMYKDETETLVRRLNSVDAIEAQDKMGLELR